MKDIVKDDSAIYGFKPSETGSLKQYASADWSATDFGTTLITAQPALCIGVPTT